MTTNAHHLVYTLGHRAACAAHDMKPGSIFAYRAHVRDVERTAVERRLREYAAGEFDTDPSCWLCGQDVEPGMYTQWEIAGGRAVAVCDLCSERGS